MIHDVKELRMSTPKRLARMLLLSSMMPSSVPKFATLALVMGFLVTSAFGNITAPNQKVTTYTTNKPGTYNPSTINNPDPNIDKQNNGTGGTQFTTYNPKGSPYGTATKTQTNGAQKTKGSIVLAVDLWNLFFGDGDFWGKLWAIITDDIFPNSLGRAITSLKTKGTRVITTLEQAANKTKGKVETTAGKFEGCPTCSSATGTTGKSETTGIDAIVAKADQDLSG